MTTPAHRRTAVATLDPPGEAHCCPDLDEAVELIGKRWSGAIIVVLLEGGAMRFSEIAHAIPQLSDRRRSERKKELAEAVIQSGEGFVTELSTESLRELFELRKEAVEV